MIFDILLQSSELPSSTGTCLHACILLREMLYSAGFDNIKIRGGNGDDDGGFFTSEGGYGHYWCEVTRSGLCQIIDITADQFGYDKILIINAFSTEWPRYIPGNQDTVDHHISNAMDECSLASHCPCPKL